MDLNRLINPCPMRGETPEEYSSRLEKAGELCSQFKQKAEEERAKYESALALRTQQDTTNIVVFHSHKILMFVINKNEFWFFGTELAKDLDYKNPSDAIKYHCHEKDIIDEVELARKIKNLPQYKGVKLATGKYINLSGCFALVLGSTLPNAKEFKHILTSEVIPEIARTGKYESPFYKESQQPQQKPIALLPGEAKVKAIEGFAIACNAANTHRERTERWLHPLEMYRHQMDLCICNALCRYLAENYTGPAELRTLTKKDKWYSWDGRQDGMQKVAKSRCQLIGDYYFYLDCIEIRSLIEEYMVNRRFMDDYECVEELERLNRPRRYNKRKGKPQMGDPDFDWEND